MSSPNDCQEAIAGGTQPNSRHTYDGIAYVDSTGRWDYSAKSDAFVYVGSVERNAFTFRLP